MGCAKFVTKVILEHDGSSVVIKGRHLEKLTGPGRDSRGKKRNKR